MTKRCFKCESDLPIENFYRHPRMKDGYLNKCKPCAKSDVRQNYSARRDQYLNYERTRQNLPHRVEARKQYTQTEAGKKSHAEALKRHAERHPEQHRAHVVFRNAVRDKKVRVRPCFICGNKAEGHHPDYSDPLYVVWLCTTHHRHIHKLMQKETPID